LDYAERQSFGSSVDIDGEHTNVGAPIFNGQDASAAYIFKNSAGGMKARKSDKVTQ